MRHSCSVMAGLPGVGLLGRCWPTRKRLSASDNGHIPRRKRLTFPSETARRISPRRGSEYFLLNDRDQFAHAEDEILVSGLLDMFRGTRTSEAPGLRLNVIAKFPSSNASAISGVLKKP